ncbi:MAG: DegT/DnrJ/EryC1/StrS family aminotransferase [Deltaproteobacteria bacterium]|nr:DegT/DnrJ/EryC1/StrS family aminotransferase [Deltaproteobacteria bacterium]
MTSIPMLDLARLHAPVADEMKRVFAQTLESSRFIGGPAVERFEEQLAERVGTPGAIGVSSGTDALIVALMGLGVKPGDDVITSPYTFFATAGSIARLGARPVFVDIEPDTFNINPALIEDAITERTVGIIPVHLFGQCAEMEPILELAKARGLWVLEDAAQAIGAKYHGRAAGTMGVATAFSFFPAKNLGALGDAGAAVTNDTDLGDRLKALRQHGAVRKYFHETVGGNFRLDALQAALLSVKLPLLSSWEQGRRRVADRYRALLGSHPEVMLPIEREGNFHVFNQYVIRTPRRDALKQTLVEAGIGCAVYYPKCLHLQECFSSLGHRRGDFVEAERAAKETLAIPVDPNLGDEAIEQIAKTII